MKRGNVNTKRETERDKGTKIVRRGKKVIAVNKKNPRMKKIQGKGRPKKKSKKNKA